MRLEDSTALARDRDLRICGAPIRLPGRPIDLLRNLRLILRKGYDIGKIKTAPARIHELVKQDTLSITSGRYVIVGGERKGENRLRLDNGARLNFSLVVRSVATGLEVLAYSFHLRYSRNRLPRFIRFDYIDADHADPVMEPRSHIHPGHNKVRLPAPVLTPVEMLHVLLHSLERA